MWNASVLVNRWNLKPNVIEVFRPRPLPSQVYPKFALPSNAPLFQFFSTLWRCDPTRVMTSSFLRSLDHTQRRRTVGRTPLDEWSARLRDLYLTTHNTHNRHTSMPLVWFELTISAGERPQTYALDRAANGPGSIVPVNCHTSPSMELLN
jgi:hypothetical protein